MTPLDLNELLIARNGRVKVMLAEMPSIRLSVAFGSVEGQRMYRRLYESFQISAHFVCVTADSRIADKEDEDVVEAHLTALREALDFAYETIGQAIDEVDLLFKAHGIETTGIFGPVPFRVTVKVHSSTERRFLDVITRLDQTMLLLQMLETHEVSTSDMLDRQRSKLKQLVRDVLKTTRHLASELRLQMDAKWTRARDFDS